jgi:hypothetical protein
LEQIKSTISKTIIPQYYEAEKIYEKSVEKLQNIPPLIYNYFGNFSKWTILTVITGLISGYVIFKRMGIPLEKIILNTLKYIGNKSLGVITIDEIIQDAR